VLAALVVELVVMPPVPALVDVGPVVVPDPLLVVPDPAPVDVPVELLAVVVPPCPDCLPWVGDGSLEHAVNTIPPATSAKLKR
jgi:hypothetical protein